MPLYDYECSKRECLKVFSKIKRISERGTAECPSCGSVSAQKLTAPRGINGGYYDQSVRLS